MGTTVFGAWLAPIASFVAVGVIAAAIVLHAIGRPDQLTDFMAVGAFGLIFGIAPGIVAGHAASAANARLDAIGAPPANGKLGDK